jgi:hypothetical protein
MGAFVMATMPMWRTWWHAWLKSTTSCAPTMTAAALAVVTWMFVVQHLDHYLDRAQINDRGLLVEIMAQPICAGAQTTPVAATSAESELMASIMH